MKKKKRLSGIERRWFVNNVGVIMLLVLACVLGVVLSMAAYYDTNLRSGLENRAKTTTDFFSNYIGQSYNEYYQSCIRFAQTFEEKNNLELQFISTSGKIVASSYGQWAGQAPETSDIADAIATGEISHFMGRNPHTGERILAVSSPMIYVNGEVIGTLHVSFMQPPENIVQILNVLLELSPVLSTFLFAVLSEERLEKMRAAQAGSPRSPEADVTGSILLASSLLETPDMKKLMALARKVAKLHIPVMILGETGTGKSMLARWLHLHSPRRKNSFVKVNCPSLPPTLFESEMFGYAKGAFTGATSKRVGRVELAQGGTLFLDEIGELAPEMQSKLLQVLEENSFERVGEAAPIGVDMRVMSATNIDMAEAMDQGRLRRDLYYRLGSVVLRMPPLRERRNDIPLFVEHFVRKFSREYEIHPPRLSRPVMDVLQEHVWPGNIRELRNVVSRLLLQTLDGQITGSFVDEALHLWKGPAGTAPPAPAAPASGIVAGNAANSPPVPAPARQEAPPGLLSLEDNERAHIEKALRLCGGKLSGPGGAADMLGIPRSTLQQRIRKLGIR